MIPTASSILRRRATVRSVLRLSVTALMILVAMRIPDVVATRMSDSGGWSFYTPYPVSTTPGTRAEPNRVFAAATMHIGPFWLSAVALLLLVSRLVRWIVPVPSPTCPVCGYALLYTPQPRCPECGIALEPERFGPAPAPAPSPASSSTAPPA